MKEYNVQSTNVQMDGYIVRVSWKPQNENIFLNIKLSRFWNENHAL